MSSQANAALFVEQYLGFQSNNVNVLKNYADNNVADTSTYWDIIDFTDDPGGFAGALPGSNPWPSAAAAGVSGTGGINNVFFAKITGNFYVPTLDDYIFRTFNDDGVFLFIDGLITINDASYHPEREFQGTQRLGQGVHSVELYFFENGGEASLEFSLADSSGTFTHFDNPALQVPQQNIPEPSVITLMVLAIFGLMFVRRKVLI